MMRKASLLGSLALLLVSACADDEQTGIGTARSQMKPLVDAACDWMFGCCSPGELTYQLGDFTVDADDCSGRILDAITAGVPLELEQAGLSDDPAGGLLVLALSINEGRVDVDSGAVRECADGTSERACNSALAPPSDTGRCTPSATGPEADPCEPDEMFRGKQDVGEKCDGPWECSEGLRCVDFGISGVCALRAKNGESCFSDAECADGLICNYEEGTCRAGAKSGEACAFTDPANPIPGTESIRCAEGLSCDSMLGACVGGYCSPGSPCFDIFDDSDCPMSYYCVGNFVTQPSCQQPGIEGAPCSKPDDCSSGYCDPFNEVCGTLLGNGENCFDNAECGSGFCDGGLCQLSVGAGQPCDSFQDAQCQDGFCNTAGAMPLCEAYANENGPCPNGNECDPDDDLYCVDATCLRQPFPNGTTCFDGSVCQSKACFNGECTAGAVVGAQCRTDGSTEPCIVGSYCAENAPGSVDGVCADLKGSGEACLDSSQCWGECIVRFGSLMCDATPAFGLGKAWCDGE
ncbi:hypothetical protein [Paraliomyxa miuraensis]|uniref:hypothetical protein n=1 Tax=Paraliomyxa miuraensis TaxID=376150 RepID=UPI0022510E0B|nr:hypothetical protein [Paraliomyxa miuraensis]MCX4241771.1 hypothetical protein [Paraliomyxa miuraensis]